MLYSISIVPIFLYLGVLMLLDGFSMIKWGRLSVCMAWGVAASALAFYLFNAFPSLSQAPLWVHALLEEFLKGLAIALLIRLKRVVFSIDSTIYGAAVGGGFALLENILYINSEMYWGTALFRGLGTAVMHMGMTAIVGVLLVMMTRRRNTPFLFYPIALLPSILFHYLFNRFLVNPFMMLVVDLVVLTALFAFLFAQNQKSIYKWLDRTMLSDSLLLSAMRRGEFTSTPTGAYLLSVKAQFQPEVFFDIYCYVRLYLELSMVAKRNLMLTEVGLPLIEDSEVTNQVQEFHALKKRIGKIGLAVLRPIVSNDKIDTWMLHRVQ